MRQSPAGAIWRFDLDRSSPSVADHEPTLEALRFQAQLLDAIEQAIIATTLDGTITYWNSFAERLYGWTSVEALGRNILELTPTALSREQAAVLLADLRAGRSWSGEFLVQRRDGTTFPAMVVDTPLRDSSGALVGIVGLSSDITTRKQTEQALRESEARFRATFEQAAVGIAHVGLDGHWLQVNQRLCEILGYTRAELLARTFQEMTLPEDLAADLAQIEQLLAGTITTYTMEKRYIRNDCSMVWVSLTVSLVRDTSGAPLNFIAVIEDIDVRKRAAGALAVLADASAVLTNSLDEAATLTNVAKLSVPRLADWCAVDLVDAGVVRRLVAVYADPADAEAKQALERRFPLDPQVPGVAEVLRTGRPQLLSELSDTLLAELAPDAEAAQPEGAPGLASCMILPLQARNQLLGALTLVSMQSGRRYDALDLAYAEELARRAALAADNARLYRAAQAAVQEREALLSVASHELKSPLTALLGYARLLQSRLAVQDAIRERDHRALAAIVEQGERLERMLNTLLDVSRLEAGRLIIARAPVDLNAVARRMVEEARTAIANEPDPHLVTFTGADRPLVVLGDELRLEQVVRNLLSNALRYSPGGSRVTVVVERSGEQVRLTVADEGIGVPQTALPHLFKRFYQAPNGGARNVHGLGVGLYVVGEVVSLHGGTVEVTSSEGRGSTFVVRLPLA